jgi:DNA-binding XRE family transcriptional regulator
VSDPLADRSFVLSTDEVQLVALALAALAAERPGWDAALGMIVDKLDVRVLYEGLKDVRRPSLEPLMVPTPNAVGAVTVGNLQRLRQARFWTQAELARRSGVSRQQISKLESQPVGARVTTIKLLAEALGVPLEELVRG